MSATASSSGTSEDHHLYHLVSEDLWQAAKTAGRPYYPPTYEQDGFTHLSKDAKFLMGIGNHFYKGVPGSFLLLVLDPKRLTSKVVFEPAAAVGNKSAEGLTEDAPLFPHLYGTIDYDAVTQELQVLRGPDGAFLSIEGLSF